MKQLFIIRHAKSSLNTLTDFDRSLHKRGQLEAAEMAQKLITKKIAIDAFVSSTAVRAMSTATYFLEAFQQKGKLLYNQIIEVPELYEAELDTFFQVTEQIDDTIQSAALFSHNPGITEFAYKCSNFKKEVVPMPTCGVVGIRADADSWKDFSEATKHFLFFYYPTKK
ncbi:histidine phosphatase family protein [Hydrotalea sp.]|uniref:SixA phosphatase family protein n=1 Tax=Hydrotalea sp. TaxID=2881279 RepID=UPI00260AE83B|nr:histidine phosphatase family protein [Hydrotalea sp.]